MTIASLLQAARQQLAPYSDTAGLDSEILLATVLGRGRTYLHAWPERELEAGQQQDFQALLERRLAGEPVAYITGYREFWSMNLKVTPATLIPRPETEILVEQALSRIPPSAAWRLLDVGTGSGAIALALARERPQCQVVGTDVSVAALAVARENAGRLGDEHLQWLQGSFFEPVAGRRFHMIVSNPPYVAVNDPYLQQGDLRFEPRNALTTGGTGLEAITLLVQQAPAYLEAGGWLLMEFGYDQSPAVRRVLEQAGYKEIVLVRDYQGHSRMVAARIESS